MRVRHELEPAVLDPGVRVELDPELVGHGLDLWIGHVHAAALPNDGGVGGATVADQKIILLAIGRSFHIETGECELELKVIEFFLND